MRNDLKYLNIHKKATHQEYILKNNENNGPGGGVLARFFCPSDGDFALSLCPGGGN